MKKFLPKKKRVPSLTGFTLIEVLVAAMIFSVVMTVALGALLAMSESDRRAQALKSVINNLNFALESVSRTVRTGTNYHCGASGADLLTPGPQNCTSGSGQPYLALRAADGSRVAYCLSGTTIMRQVIPATDTTTSLSSSCGSSVFLPLTSSEVSITALQFIVIGACATGGGGCTGDTVQPKVTVLLNGSVRVSATQTTPLALQTSITQRVFDQ